MDVVSPDFNPDFNFTNIIINQKEKEKERINE